MAGRTIVLTTLRPKRRRWRTFSRWTNLLTISTNAVLIWRPEYLYGHLGKHREIKQMKYSPERQITNFQIKNRRTRHQNFFFCAPNIVATIVITMVQSQLGGIHPRALKPEIPRFTLNKNAVRLDTIAIIAALDQTTPMRRHIRKSQKIEPRILQYSKLQASEIKSVRRDVQFFHQYAV